MQKTQKILLKWANKMAKRIPKLSVEIHSDEITVYVKQKGCVFEVVHWVKDEWVEDPFVTVQIAMAIHLAYTDPARLVKINKEHIESQKKIISSPAN